MDVIIACKTIQKELERAILKTDCPLSVVWVESGLHDTPEQLRKKLQELMDSISDVEHVILAFGFCGNALSGLVSNNGFKLVFPRVDDCITLMLGSSGRRKELSKNTYFVTQGWLSSEKTLWSEYDDAVEQYGQEGADYIYEQLLGDYTRLVAIDTEAASLGDLKRQATEISAKFDLELKLVSFDDRLINKLLTGPWDGDFVVVPPGEQVGYAHLFDE